MSRQHIGYVVLGAAILVSPACTNANGDKDRPYVDERSPAGTDGTGMAARPGVDERATGTAGSVAQGENGAGPDATITMRIQARYAEDTVVKGRDIDVDTENGVVTLKGSVDSRRERDAAEQIARETAGVKRVENQLRVATR